MLPRFIRLWLAIFLTAQTYAEILPRSPLVGPEQGDFGFPRELLMPVETFRSKYTDRGFVYHGTPQASQAENMMLHGMRASTVEVTQLNFAKGWGTFTTPESTWAIAHADDRRLDDIFLENPELRGVLLPLEVENNPNLRILDLKSHFNAPFINELKSKHVVKMTYHSDYDWPAIFKELRDRYKIDVIIHFQGSSDGKARNVVFLNHSALHPPAGFNDLMEKQNRLALDPQVPVLTRLHTWLRQAHTRRYIASRRVQVPAQVPAEKVSELILQQARSSSDLNMQLAALSHLSVLKTYNMLGIEQEIRAKEILLENLASPDFSLSHRAALSLEDNLQVSTKAELRRLLEMPSNGNLHSPSVSATLLLHRYLQKSEKRAELASLYVELMNEGSKYSLNPLADALSGAEAGLSVSQVDGLLRFAKTAKGSEQWNAFIALSNKKAARPEAIVQLALSAIGSDESGGAFFALRAHVKPPAPEFFEALLAGLKKYFEKTGHVSDAGLELLLQLEAPNPSAAEMATRFVLDAFKKTAEGYSRFLPAAYAHWPIADPALAAEVATELRDRYFKAESYRKALYVDALEKLGRNTPEIRALFASYANTWLNGSEKSKFEQRMTQFQTEHPPLAEDPPLKAFTPAVVLEPAPTNLSPVPEASRSDCWFYSWIKAVLNSH